MITFPNCKINLGLSVVGKRPDGFHNLETVFYPVPLHDSLEIATSDNFVFNTHGITIPGDTDDNLCVQAYRLLQQDFDISTCRFELTKHIPLGAGLGGGSSDASSTLLLLNDFFELGLSNEQLIGYASQLGSDCAFFIENRPILASGKGDVMQPIDLDLSSYSLVIVKPDIHVNTGWAYSQIAINEKPTSIFDILQQPISSWKDKLINDFEKPIFKAFPEIENIKEALYDLGAVYACMSGSGSSVFGLFKEKIDSQFFEQYEFVWQGGL